MKKKLLVIAAVVAVVAVMIAGTTLAYFTVEDTKKNVFEIGAGVDVELTEEEWDDEEEHPVIPGKEYAKDPTVTVNDGGVDCYVRFVIEVTEREDIDKIVANYLKRTGKTSFDPSALLSDFDASIYNDIVVERPDSGTYADSTVYYLTVKEALSEGDSVTAFTGVTFPADLATSDFYKDGDTSDNANKFDISSFNINVTAQVIQAEGFDTAADAFAAWED